MSEEATQLADAAQCCALCAIGLAAAVVVAAFFRAVSITALSDIKLSTASVKAQHTFVVTKYPTTSFIWKKSVDNIIMSVNNRHGLITFFNGLETNLIFV